VHFERTKSGIFFTGAFFAVAFGATPGAFLFAAAFFAATSLLQGGDDVGLASRT
jgi:hypothetical protein